MKNCFKFSIVAVLLFVFSCSEKTVNETDDLSSRASEQQLPTEASQIKEISEVEREKSQPDTSYIKTNYFDISGSFEKQALELLEVSSLDSLSMNTGKTFELERYLNEALTNEYEFDQEAFGDNAGTLITQYFDGIYTSLPDFIASPERHDGYYSERNESKYPKEKLLAYLVYRIDRSPENIRKIWNHQKHWFYGHLLFQNDTKKVIQELSQSYLHLMTIKDYDSRLDSAYHSVDSLNQKKQYPEYDSGAYGISSNDVFEFLKPLAQSDTAEYNRIEWVYSFWMRRQHEGNLKEVASILEEIIEHEK